MNFNLCMNNIISKTVLRQSCLTIVWRVATPMASAIFLILCLTDWGIFERRFNAPHNLKAIKLSKAPVDTILAVLSGRVEEVELGLEPLGKVHLLICM